MPSKRQFLKIALALAWATGGGAAAAADTGPIKVGLILPMTGQSASTGRQIDAAVKLWMAQNGNKIAGRSVEVIL
jgi:branched-chain amino acid transport system substrate-binding protein